MTEKLIIEQLKPYYPYNLSYLSGEYQKTKEYKYLEQYLDNKKTDNRWALFKELLDKSEYANDYVDHTFYAIVKVSFEVNTGFKGDAGRYSFFFYISMLLPYYSFKSRLVYRPPIDIESFPREEWPALIKKYQVEEEVHEAKHPYRYNIAPPGLEKPVQDFLNAQQASFNYSMFPTESLKKIVPNISVNSKDLGEATFFDCLFMGGEY